MPRSVRRRVRRGLRRARRPRVLRVLLATAAVLAFALVVLVVQRESGLSAEEVTRVAAPSLVQPTVPVSVIGDGFAEGASTQDVPGANWASLLAGTRNWALTNTAVGGTGYVIAVPGTRAFEAAQLDTAMATKPRLVIVEGSRNDAGEDPDAVGAAASKLYRDIRARAPGAPLVVVGPVWSTANAPEPILAVRDAVRKAATDAQALWVDPIAGGWFDAPTNPAGQPLIGGDNVHPTLAGQEVMAQRIGAALSGARL